MKFFDLLITIGVAFLNILTVIGIAWEILHSNTPDMLAVLVIGPTVILFDIVLIGAYNYYKGDN